MQTLMVYSETGGATKTATAISLAMVAASDLGKRVTYVDLDPRAAGTKWLGVEPVGPGLDIGAVLANPDVDGWAEGMAAQTTWHPNLRAIPSDRSVSMRERDQDDHSELRLASALEGIESDLVVIDCPNRQGGPLILNALNAADTVIYAATATSDGVDGYLGAQRSVQRFKESRRKIKAPDQHPEELGVVMGAIKETIMSRSATHSIEEVRSAGMLITPLVPNRAIVDEARYTHEWFGNYRKGTPVVDAYREIAGKVIR